MRLKKVVSLIGLLMAGAVCALTGCGMGSVNEKVMGLIEGEWNVAYFSGRNEDNETRPKEVKSFSSSNNTISYTYGGQSNIWNIYRSSTSTKKDEFGELVASYNFDNGQPSGGSITLSFISDNVIITRTLENTDAYGIVLQRKGMSVTLSEGSYSCITKTYIKGASSNHLDCATGDDLKDVKQINVTTKDAKKEVAWGDVPMFSDDDYSFALPIENNSLRNVSCMYELLDACDDYIIVGTHEIWESLDSKNGNTYSYYNSSVYHFVKN